MFLALAFSYASLIQETPLWAQLKEPVVRLIDVEGSSGVAALLSDGVVVRFDEKGKEVKRDVVKSSSRPGETVFSQFGNEIHIRKGLVVYSKEAVFSRPTVDNLSAVAVTNDGKNVAVLTRPMSAPILQQYRFNGAEWSPQGNVVSPEVEGVGLACVFPRFNDLRFVGDNQVVFIGGLWSSQEQTASSNAILEKRLRIKQPAYRLEDTRGRDAFAYVFITNLSSRVTEPLVKVVVSGSGESGGFRAGRLSVSEDGRWVYLACQGGIARIPVQ